ncbi:hypothetical protein MHB50_12295 [Siminovitchia sp. FSL H7-0308]|uniref:hypothetical protein n=1 Tax=unclassified Siminovitchia TaxID=2837530 RepID=UPI0030CAC1DA
MAIMIFYIPSYYFIKKFPQKIYYLLPAIVPTVGSVLFIIYSYLFIPDGWFMMGVFLYAFADDTGSFIGKLLPFLYLTMLKRQAIVNAA